MQSPPEPSVELDCFRLADFPDPDFLFLKTCMSEYYGRCFARPTRAYTSTNRLYRLLLCLQCRSRRGATGSPSHRSSGKLMCEPQEYCRGQAYLERHTHYSG